MSSTQLENAGVNPTRPWPADQQERWPIERLMPYANNARLHSETDLDKLASSILKFGWTMPPLVDEQGALIVGQGRVEAAATRLGIKEVPVLVARGWSWYAVREGKSSRWQGGRTQTTVWEIANNNPFGNRPREQSWGKATQKPVECMRRPIANNSRPGQAIYDPFLGSGTSLIAAEMTGRVCYGVELTPGYVDVVVRRWQGFTGRAAIHQASGQSFDERAASQQRDQSGSAHG